MGNISRDFTRVSKPLFKLIPVINHHNRKIKDLRHNEDNLIADLVQQQKIAKDSLRAI